MTDSNRHFYNRIFFFYATIESDEFAKTKLENLIITSNLVGNYNVTNINAAITIGKYFEIDNIFIKEAIEEYVPSNNRSQLIQLKGNEIILDCYNANPSSMQVAIDNFLSLNKKNKWLILGDMFELGEDSSKEHAQIVNLLKNLPNNHVSFIGERFFEHQIEAKNMFFYKSYDDFDNSSKNKNIQNKCLLIKGSRGMALERVLNLI